MANHLRRETYALYLAYHHLAALHPFIDGNGCTARLVMNLVLMRVGYPPTVIQRINRRQYDRVFAQADAGKPAALVNFVGRAVERSLSLFWRPAHRPSPPLAQKMNGSRCGKPLKVPPTLRNT